MTETHRLKKSMPEHMLLDIIRDRNDIRKEFPDWLYTVYEEIHELYKFKEKYWDMKKQRNWFIELYERGDLG